MPKLKANVDKFVRLLLLAAILALAVFFIVQRIHVFGKILLVVLGFGAVILIHEFGHFLFAKISGIKVEAFSIGFSPVIIGILKTENGFRIRILPGFFRTEEDDESDGCLATFTLGKKGKAGETEYRIGLIPFGGFVKMLGQDDTKVEQTSDDPRSYINKPVYSRMAVIAAGVVFNAISAIIIFMIVFLAGINLTPPVVGGVEPGSPAAIAGLKAGDEIIEIAGKKKDLDFSSIAMAAALSGKNESIPLKVKRPDQSIKTFEISAKQMPGTPLRLFGVIQPQSLTIAKLQPADANLLFENTGLKPGDNIKSIAGTPIENHWQMAEIIENLFVPAAIVTVERTDPQTGKKIITTANINLQIAHAVTDVNDESDLGSIYSMVPRLQISYAREDIELKANDIILAAADVENPTYSELRRVTEKFENKTLPIKVLRKDAKGKEEIITVNTNPKKSTDSDRVLIGIAVTLDAQHPVVAKTINAKNGLQKLNIPRGASITAVDGVEVSNFYQIINEINKNKGHRIGLDYRLNSEIAGDVFINVSNKPGLITVRSELAQYIPFKELQKLYRADNPIQAVKMGYRRAVMFIAQACLTLKRFATGLVSPKNFMGPVGIATLSYKIVTEKPLIYYIYFLGLISAFIAVFNSLPFLPFDGGHIVFLAIEKIKGSPVSEKVQAAIMYVGLAVVLSFAAYVTFNDIVRSFFS